MVRAGTTAYTAGRILASLKWDGVTPNRDGMFIVPEGAPQRVFDHLERLCAKDDRYDWKLAGDGQ